MLRRPRKDPRTRTCLPSFFATPGTYRAYSGAVAMPSDAVRSGAHPLGYYASDFLAANVPIAFLALKESAVVETDEARSRMRGGTALYRAITVIGFLSVLRLS